MKKEPNRIKLTDNPTSKDVKRLPLPPLYQEQTEELTNTFIRPDNDSIYTPIENEDNTQNNS